MISPFTILILCTGNSCRSIMAEAILRQLAGDRLRVLSAGSHPKGAVDAGALATLERHGIGTDGLRSKSWDAFSATPVDLVITVCNQAAGEVCPWYPGQKTKSHLGMADPSKVEGSLKEIREAYEAAYALLDRRMQALLALDLEHLGPKELQEQISALAARYPEESGLQNR